MKPKFLVRVSIAFSLLGCFFNRSIVFGQIQDFESNFSIVNHPEEFLPNWSGNEVRATASRVFQATGEGRSGSTALGIQPISSFDGQVFTSFSPVEFLDPKIVFFAKSKRNGSGNRPALVSIWFSTSGFEDFSFSVPIGDENTFPNDNLDLELFEIPIPEDFKRVEVLFLKIEVKYGPGSGSAARFFMDDFGIFDGKEVIDPISVKRSRLLDPYSIELTFDKEFEKPTSDQVKISGLANLTLQNPTDSSLYIFSEEILEDPKIILILENIIDKTGTITPELEVEVDNNTIDLGSLLLTSSNSIRLSFSQFFLESSVSRTSHFKINGKHPESIEIPENNFQIHLTFQEEFQLESILEIEAHNIQNAKGEFGNGPLLQSMLYQDHIESIFLSKQDVLMIFQTIDIDTSSVSADSFLIEDAEEYLFDLSFPKNSQMQLKSNKLFEEGPVFNIHIPARRSKRGLPIHASKRPFIWDITPPELVNITPLDKNKILLVFSEALDKVYAGINSFYTIDSISPIEVLFQTKENQLILSWDFEFESEKKYRLEIAKSADLNGNFREDYFFEFQFAPLSQIGFKEIVINEVMAAPRPGNILPNAEYVELYNTGDRHIYLGGYQLANSRRETTLPSAVLEPKSYLILAPRARIADFEKYGKVVGLGNWPSLLNSGDQVKLRDSGGSLIDSLQYSTVSYGGSAFAQGGYSLEIANPYLTCFLNSNLKASLHEKRGTPGKVNSVYEVTPDLTPPTFLKSQLITDNMVKLSFSKYLNQNIGNVEWSFRPDLTLINSIIGENPSEIILEFAENLQEGYKYIVNIKNLRDCSGNLFDHSEEVWMIVPSTAEKGDIILNEVLFNARSNAPKFVEIYNRSEKFINLKDWKLANLNSYEETANRRILFQEDFILEPFSFLVFTTDAEKLKQEYPKSKESRFRVYPSLPSYPISSGNVLLLNPDESIEERFSYSDRMHHPLLRETKGVSLERISAKAPANDPVNWQSASASEGYATPGYRNSQVFEGQEVVGIEINPKVFAPDIPGQAAFVTISYKMEQPGKNASMRIYNIAGGLIREICQNAIWGNEGFYLWDGTDVNGRKVRPGHYIVWIELFDLNGNVSQIKKTVVVGTFF